MGLGLECFLTTEQIVALIPPEVRQLPAADWFRCLAHPGWLTVLINVIHLSTWPAENPVVARAVTGALERLRDEALTKITSAARLVA